MKFFFTLLLVLSSIFSAEAQFTRQISTDFLTDVHIVDNATSYAVGRSLGQDDIAYLYKRTGTANFVLIKTLTNAVFEGCHFFNAQNGLICGTTATGAYIWRTTDGGVTLTPQLLSAALDVYPTDFHFISSTIGYLRTYSVIGGSKIYKTTNGGTSWQIVGGGATVLIEDISFLTETIGHRLNATTDSLEITRNGAQTWQALNTPEKAMSYCFQTEQTGFVGTNTGEMWKTTNGGTAWTRILKFPNADITKIRFPTPSVGYAHVIQEKEYIYRTTDGGATWNTVFIGSQSVFEILNQLKCLDANTVVGVGFGEIVTANNASTTAALPLSSLWLSGIDTNCTGTMKLRFDLTGTPPWTVNLQDINADTRTFTATTTPFMVDFTPNPVQTAYTLSAFSVKGANEPTASRFVGGTASVVVPNPTAAFTTLRSDTVCYNAPLSYPIRLTGCPPFSLKIRDQYTDTLIENIQTNNFIYRTKADYSNFQGSLYSSVRIDEIRSGTLPWQNVSADLAEIVLKSPPSSATLELVGNASVCLNTDVEFRMDFQGLPPFNFNLSDGVRSISLRTNELRVSEFVNIKRTGTWRLTQAADGCGSFVANNSSVDIVALPIPQKPSNLAYQRVPQEDSIAVTWRDNNNPQLGSYKISVNYSWNWSRPHDLGEQVSKFDFYDIFRGNEPVIPVYVKAVDQNNTCETASDTILIPSLVRTIHRDSFRHSPPNTGVALADMNNDKLPDILAASGYYINRGNFAFDYRAQDFGGTPSVVGDMDNDGDLDFLVNNATENTTKIYYNNGNFSFTLKQTLNGANATLFDYDFNGLLDVACTGAVYRNAGDNRYIFMSRFDNSKIKGKPYYYDFNADGKMELLDVYVNQDNVNLGFMTFEPVAFDENDNMWSSTGSNISAVDFVGTPHAIGFGDVYGRFGSEDFMVFSGPYSGVQLPTNYKTQPFMLFYGNAGTAQGFTTRGYTQPQNLEGYGEGAILDIDNSGTLEIIEKDLIGRDFIGFTNGFTHDYGHLSNGAPAVADFDNDGDLDIAVALPQGGIDVFENRFNFANNWLKIKLNARSTNRSGLGIWIKTYVKDSVTIATTVGGRHGGSSRSDIAIHIGLNKATRVDSIDVQWSPGKHTILRGVQANQFLTIEEPQTNIRPAYPLGSQIVTVNATQARLSWQDVATNETGYVIQRSTVSPDSGFVILDTLAANAISYLTPIRTGAYYRIYAFNAVAHSAYSNSVSLTTPSVCDLLTTVDTFFIAPEKKYSSCDSLVPLTVPQVAGYQYQWFLNDRAIANATTRSFNATQSGIYTLQAKTAVGCTRLLAPVTLAISNNITPRLTPQTTICSASTNILRTTPKSSAYTYTIQYRERVTDDWATVSTVDSFVAAHSGQYQTLLEHKLTGCTYASAIETVSLGSRLSLLVYASPEPSTACKTSVTLKNPAINKPNTVFTWLKLINGDTMRIGTPQLTVSNVSQYGTYVLFGKDTLTGCEGHSIEVNVFLNYPTASYRLLDSFNCLTRGGRILLNPTSQNDLAILQFKGLSGWENSRQTTFIDSFTIPKGIYRVIAQSNRLRGCDSIYPEFEVKDTIFTVSGKVTLPNNTPSVSTLVQLLSPINPNVYAVRATDTTDANGRYNLKSDYNAASFIVLATPFEQPMAIPTYFGNTITSNTATALAFNSCQLYPNNDIQLKTTPIANASTINACQPFAVVNVSNGNSRNWLSLIDSTSGIVADINPNGNLLGQITGGYFINASGTIRRASGTPYLDRNIGIKVTNQPTTDVGVRLYFTERERAAYFAAVGANPIAVTHYAGALCLGNVQSGSGDLLPAVVRSAPNGNYYVEFNTRRFSGFFIGPNNSLVFSNEVNSEPHKLRIEAAYPLPVTTELAVIFTAQQRSEQGKVFITDILGKIVLEKGLFIESGQNDLRLDMSALSNGLYFLNISDGVRQVSKKIVKQ